MFTVDPAEIKDFGGQQLVALLRVLLHAEARKAGIPLRNVDAPLQITIADGGVDGSVGWKDGADKTDYFPGRDVIFQCKATDHGPAQWTKEVWTKQTQAAKVKAKALNPAVEAVLARGGSYIGVTATELVGTKPADRAAAIANGIRQAGGDPSKITIQVYDGNKLAAWASSHPAVALWIKEQRAQAPLSSFSTLGQWGKRAEIATPAFVASAERAFSLGAGRTDSLDFGQLAARIVDHLEGAGACIRVWGAAGIGKTRAVHEALSASTGALREIAAANFIFCDFRDVPIKVREVANQIKNDGLAAVLIVDNCPMDEALALNALARATDSQLRVVTIGTEGRDNLTQCLAIRPEVAGRDTIRGILSAGLPSAKSDEISFIADFCDGFPGIAVLAVRSYAEQSVLKSADDLAEQILKGASLGRETVRALECLSLFEQLKPDDDPRAFDRIAESLAHMSGGLMFEHLIIASEQHLVLRGNDWLATRPRPIADYLALRRLSYLRESAIIEFLLSAPVTQRNAMLGRWRHLWRSRTLAGVIRAMLKGALADTDKLLSEESAVLLAPFAYVDPDTTATHLFWAIANRKIDDLVDVPVTEGLLHALRLLASRESSFPAAALMILRLAAVADLDANPPILDLLRQIFQVALAGTTASERRRREAIDRALEEDDTRIKRACVEALGAMLRTYLTRSTEFEQVGADRYQEEWRPENQGAVQEYFKWALERLLAMWRAFPDLRSAIQKIVAADFRNLLDLDLLPIIQALVEEVVRAEGSWSDATNTIGDWLYYDRPDPPDTFAIAVRALYDATLPAEPVKQALLYSRYWAADLHDPDRRYDPKADDLDFDYASRRAQALAPAIARDPEQLRHAITAMASENLKAPQAFAEALAMEVPDPIETFTQAVAALDASGTRHGIGFVRALLSWFDRRLAGEPQLSAAPMDIHVALRTTDERLVEIAGQVRDGVIGAHAVVVISYGRGLETVSAAALGVLVRALVEQTADGGAWAALEILSMVTHDQKTLSPEHAELTKEAILSPSIADGVDGSSVHPDYVHERMLKLLAASGEIDGAFARGFALQIELACRSVGARSNRPVEALRTALAIVIKHGPAEIWAALSGFYLAATRAEQERLNQIIAPTKAFAWDESRTGAGTLFEVPLASMLEWAEQDVDARIGFLVSFFPILEQDGEAHRWHPALQQLADRFGGSTRFRKALRSRIFPSSWGGSLNAHLTSFKKPIEAWCDRPELRDWAQSTLDQIDHRLAERFYQ